MYVAPPDYHLLVETDKTFSLSADEHVQFSRPSIDVLSESAAVAFREKLIGIILTGSNADGSAGISTISKLGGLTIAQDLQEAQYSFMPHSAVETRHVEHVWTLSQIAEYLRKIYRFYAKAKILNPALDMLFAFAYKQVNTILA